MKTYSSPFYEHTYTDEDVMYVSSLPKYGNNSLFSICKHCFDLHTFITFNHGNDKIITCKDN